MILKRIFITGLFTAFAALVMNDQVSEPAEKDSLTLNQIMLQVIQNHPMVKKAEASLKDAESKIGLAKSGYYPTVDATLSVSHVGPVPKLSIPELGSFQLFPDNNFNASVNLHQNIYDFGKTSTNISYANSNKDIVLQTVEATKQQLAIQVIKNYFSLVYLQQAKQINDLEIQNLESHLENVTKKKETGSATDFEILSTRVKLSAAQNQKIDIDAAHQVQIAILNSLLGQPASVNHNVRNRLNMELTKFNVDSLITTAMKQRYEMQIAEKKIEMANIHLDVVKAQNNPSVMFLADGGWKNGFVPDINEIRANYMIGVGVSVPIFEGTRAKQNESIARTAIETSTYESEITKRNISAEVIENEVNMNKSLQKVDQAKLQLAQAEEAFKLAQVSFNTGAITNLELLDASKNVSESELLFVKSEIDYLLSFYMLKASLGEELYKL